MAGLAAVPPAAADDDEWVHAGAALTDGRGWSAQWVRRLGEAADGLRRSAEFWRLVAVLMGEEDEEAAEAETEVSQEAAGADASTTAELENACESLRSLLRLLGRAGGSADAVDALLRHWVRGGRRDLDAKALGLTQATVDAGAGAARAFGVHAAQTAVAKAFARAVHRALGAERLVVRAAPPAVDAHGEWQGAMARRWQR